MNEEHSLHVYWTRKHPLNAKIEKESTKMDVSVKCQCVTTTLHEPFSWIAWAIKFNEKEPCYLSIVFKCGVRC